MWILLVTVIAANAGASTVVSFPTEELCHSARYNLQSAFEALYEDSQVTATCTPGEVGLGFLKKEF